MKILWVKSGGLVPLDTGGKIRSFHLAKELARRHQVSLFTFYPEHVNDTHAELASHFDHVIAVPMRLPKRASLRDCLDYARNLFSGRPHVINKYCRPEIADKLRAHLEQTPYDLIICDFLATAAVIPWDLPVPKIIFTHNVEATIWRRHFEVSRNPIWKAVSWREFRTMDNMERHYLSKADHVLTVSATDREAFSEFLDPGKITVIPTGVDTDYFHPSAGTDRQGNTMVFTGSMDWLPNEDGIFYFAEQILPLIRREVPDASLTVVGRSPSQRLLGLAEKDRSIRITGRVEDVRPYMDDAGVYIVPLRIGGGTRIKIFEAMAMGKPVVSTPIGAEGLPVTSGHDIILAESDRAFADSVLALFRDPALRTRIGGSARHLVESSYNWASVSMELEKICVDLAGGTPAKRVQPAQVGVNAAAYKI